MPHPLWLWHLLLPAGQQLCYHVLGTPQSQDVTVLADPDHATWMFGTEARRAAADGVWCKCCMPLPVSVHVCC